MKDNKPVTLKRAVKRVGRIEIKMVLTIGESIALKHALEHWETSCGSDVLQYLINAEIESGISIT